jgi:hypothetical protein
MLKRSNPPPLLLPPPPPLLLLLLLCLGACGTLPGEQPAPAVSSAPASAVAGSPSTARTAGGGGARGGATTAGIQAPAEPVDPPPDPLTQARADCWMKVESQKGMRGIDQRIAFVDKCVTNQMKDGTVP